MKVFDRMGEVCGYLDGCVQAGQLEANFENTRFALREVACTELANMTATRSFANGASLQEWFVDPGGKLMILRSSDDELKDGVFSLDIQVRFVMSVSATLRSE
jgi:hypothetical protein